MSVADVYNFEGIIEPPIANVFRLGGIIAYTSQGKLLDDGTINPKPDFQKDRPRVEIVFTKGAGAKRWHLPDNPQPNITKVMQARESAWKGLLAISLLTAADPEIHFAELPVVRNLCATLPATLDGLVLQNLCINGPLNDQGETHQYNQEKGYFVTIINYAFDFSIQNYAWALLSQ